VLQLEEERRLAYVGVTRAKEMLYITYADKRLYFGQQVSNPPSRFLIDIPQELLRAASTYRNSQKSWEFE
jgi:DNA helicase-2/ATP-dependent DNA helicase PcrA